MIITNDLSVREDLGFCERVRDAINRTPGRRARVVQKEVRQSSGGRIQTRRICRVEDDSRPIRDKQSVIVRWVPLRRSDVS